MKRALCLFFLLSCFVLGQNTADFVLRDGVTKYHLVQDVPQHVTVPKGVNAPNGPQTLHMLLTASELDILNGGTPDVYNMGGVPQPLYIGTLTGKFPGKTIPFGDAINARNVAGDDWILIGSNDSVNPGRIAVLDRPPYADSVTFPYLDGGESASYLLNDAADPIDTKHLPDVKLRAVLTSLVNINRPLLKKHPFLDKMVSIHRLDDSSFDAGLVNDRSKTLATWLCLPENIAVCGGGGVYGPRAGGAGLGRGWYTGGGEFIGNGTGGLLHQYDNDGLFYLINALLLWEQDPNSPDAAVCFAIGRAMARKTVASTQMRSDLAHPLKDGQRNEEASASFNNPPPRAAFQVHKRGTNGPTPYEAKYWYASELCFAVACPQDALLQDGLKRTIAFWANRKTSYVTTGETRCSARSLENMAWARKVALLQGDTASADKIKLNAKAVIAGAYFGASQSKDAAGAPVVVKWTPATNNAALAPFRGPQSISGHGEGLIPAMAYWAECEGAADAVTLQWIKDCAVWGLQNLTRPAGKTASGAPMREWCYYWVPNSANWNGPPASATWQGQQAWGMVALGPFLEAWYPGTYTAQCEALENHVLENPDYTVANTGAITAGPYNYSSGPKWKNMWCRSAWKLRP